MRWWSCLVLVCVSAESWGSEASVREWLQVRTAQGEVRGRRDSAGDLFVFYNIPYATAPTGPHKFKDPLPPPTWTDTYDAIDRHIICQQAAFQGINVNNLKQTENCLVANVFVPDTNEKNLSVLVYIHGGGFQIGYGDMVKTKNLMKTKDIIVVNFNYRLGIPGFLCLGTDDIPGNAGMKDQIALLRWVQQTIAAFGGNPNDVTIAGYSAGAASVDLLMISKSAEGLFHKAIPESGANIAAFTLQPDPIQIAKDIARKFNFTQYDDIYALESFYKSLSYETLYADHFMHRTDSTFLFSPCVERDTGDGAFLTDSPLSILSKGDYKKVPLLYGFADMEGLMRIYMFDILWKDKMNEKFSDFMPADLQFASDNEKEKVAKQIKQFYFGDKSVSEENILRYVDFLSDTYFVYPALRAVKLYAKSGHNQVYLYEYSFVDSDTLVVPYTNVRGATHCAQTMAVNDGDGANVTNENDLTVEYQEMKKIMRDIWHSFIRTGKPVPEGSMPAWPPADVDMSPHMSLSQNVELRHEGIASERIAFWDIIYQKYYKDPIPPPPPPPPPSPKTHTEL